ncbi:hypothetical protein [Metamycoplasma buccale]|uniref:hypothetical protein n=1 Tax=Metamycoplasma buccale TaxID=55602 RepID=UPI00398F637C
MSIDQKYYLGIGLGLTFLLMFLIAILVIYIFVKRNILRKSKKNNESIKKLEEFLLNYSKENNVYFIKKNHFKSLGMPSCDIGPFLITDKGLIIFYPNFLNGKIEGNCLEREWYCTYENRKKIFPNKMFFIDKTINKLSTKLPKDIPIIAVFLFMNNDVEVDIYNTPSYVLITKEENILSSLDEINNSLTSSLTTDKVNMVATKITNLIKK